MTSFRIEEFVFDAAHVGVQASLDPLYLNWPVVYTLAGPRQIYVGESLNVSGRLRQHLESPTKQGLNAARVVLDPTFNKSVCLDLESYLIRLLAGDGKYEVLNRNDGVTNAEYYNRVDYQQTFKDIFEALRHRGLFTRSVQQIENSDLFKLSPFKALSADQAIAVEDILSGLFDDLASEASSTIVIQGDPGTGKTVVGIYLMKLLSDIQNADLSTPVDSDAILSEFFVEGYPELLNGFRVGLVVPQQALRTSIKKVFGKTPGLDASMVLTPFQVGLAEERFDLLIVDETHRLNRRARQPSGPLNLQFAEINRRLFGQDDPRFTQLDWITAQSDHQIFLLDAAQSVRPSDVDRPTIEALVREVDRQGRRYPLTSQMRVRAGSDYVKYVRQALSDHPPEPEQFPGYDLRMFDDLEDMRGELARRDQEHGLARLVAGYAWPWKSKKDPSAYDIEIDGVSLRWNSVQVDWVASPGSRDEAGSIHTNQGYDLNYAGVIVGNDLRYDADKQKLWFDRSNYFDRNGMLSIPALGVKTNDDDLLKFVSNIYAVLLTRGMLGTYVYVCDPALRAYLLRLL